MPYIIKDKRLGYDNLISDLIDKLRENGFNEGDINYAFSKILWTMFEENKCYHEINKIIGILGCVELEFYRRKCAKLEDEKIGTNGDLVI